MTVEHIEELAPVLRNDTVYQHLGGVRPTRERFFLGLQRALAGPPKSRSGEEWLNFSVRSRESGAMLGRLEATVHDGLAEVAFLFGPEYWGKGYATEGLAWLDHLLATRADRPLRWATTVPGNFRCQALLGRCGYEQVNQVSLPPLHTYDLGDLVFRSTA